MLTDPTQPADGVRWNTANVGGGARTKCQTWLLWSMVSPLSSSPLTTTGDALRLYVPAIVDVCYCIQPWIDQDAYAVQLSDTYSRLAWDFSEAKHGGKLSPAMDDINPIWETSQQTIIKVGKYHS